MADVHIIGRYAESGEAGACIPLAKALEHPWNWDAHFTQYCSDRRLEKATVATDPMVMICAAFDYDCPNHEPSANHMPAIAELLERLPAGALAYFTANGFRVVTQLPGAFSVASQQDWESWRAYHAGLRIRLDTILNGTRHLDDTAHWLADPSCDDPSRLFRLPNVRREKGLCCYPELIGTLGSLSWEPIPVVTRAATECSDGYADRTIAGERAVLVGAVLRYDGSRLIVECPWQDEHSAGSSEAVIFHTADGLGHFHCSHNHCSDKHTNEALRAWGYDFGDEPPKGDTAPGAEPVAVTIAAASPFLDAAELAAPVPQASWLCSELEIGYGRPMLLTSDPGVGKTWATQAMALAVAGGQRLFGAFDCIQAPVLHVSLDSGVRATKRRYQRLAAGMGLDLASLPLAVCVAMPRVVDKFGRFNPQAFRAVNDRAVAMGARLVILDSLATIAAGLDENSTEIADVLTLTKDDEICWLWTHHNGKAGGYRGSSAIRAAAGVWWSVSIDEASGDRLWAREKASEDHEDDENNTTAFRTVWEFPKYPDQWPARISVSTSGASRKEDPKALCRERILAYIEANPKGVNQKQVLTELDAVELRAESKRAVLQELCDRKAIKKRKAGKSDVYFPGTALV